VALLCDVSGERAVCQALGPTQDEVHMGMTITDGHFHAFFEHRAKSELTMGTPC
jgi:hypothetical protein